MSTRMKRGKRTAARARARAAAAGTGRAEFLLEVGCEEIPADLIAPACEQLKASLEKQLREAALAEGISVEAFGGPRRLAVVVRNLPQKQEDVVRELTGPSRASAFDAEGKPTRAAEGFAASKGVRVADLFVVKLPKGEFVAARQVTRGRPARDVLGEIAPRALGEIAWPRTMRWPAEGNPRFIRRVRWVLAIFAGRVVPFEFAATRSGARTDGHRFLGKRGITVKNAADYRAKLRRNFVLVDPAERREKIRTELEALAAAHALRLHPDEELLEKVAYLNEFPSVIPGGFDAAFLELPQEILITVMRDHQKYFAVETRGRELAPHFLAVINSDRDRRGRMRAGHERVLRARFADARFFWASDQVKCRLADNLPRLKAVTYEASLGSYARKVERMRGIARALALDLVPALSQAQQHAAKGVPLDRVSIELHSEVVDRAAELAKCDLVTEMVREFPELQGIVGGLYARAQKEPEEVALAIYDHYRPDGLEDALPRNLTGCVVALADKLDALAGCFAVGKIPSGSSDPFALRRAAAGVARIIIERRLPISILRAVEAASAMLAVHNPDITRSADLDARICEFVAERARFYFQQRRGYAADEVKAAMTPGWDDLVDLGERIEALRRIRRTENFPPLAAAFKRIRNILEKSASEEAIPEAPDPARFAAEEERALHLAAEAAVAEVTRLKLGRKYEQALERIAALRPVVDLFFDKVLVMAEDRAVRANRLALLRNLLLEFSIIADFSEIATAATAGKKA
jgi:glycyl-tRNA synthetase beta chain